MAELNIKQFMEKEKDRFNNLAAFEGRWEIIMPYCPNCWKEVGDEIAYCPHCGAAQRETEYQRPRSRGWPADRILAGFIGFIIIATSLGLMVGGGGDDVGSE
ncbi:hypothetical protein ES703_01011 [subsurface metagenome]